MHHVNESASRAHGLGRAGEGIDGNDRGVQAGLTLLVGVLQRLCGTAPSCVKSELVRVEAVRPPRAVFAQGFIRQALQSGRGAGERGVPEAVYRYLSEDGGGQRILVGRREL